MIKIEEYVFDVFSGPKDQKTASNIKKFDFSPITEFEKSQQEKLLPVIKKERQYSKESGFKISEEVKFHRGMRAQEEKEFNHLVETEVNRRLELIRESEEKRAYEEGVALGKKKFYNIAKKTLDIQSQELKEVIQDIVDSKLGILQEQEANILELMKVMVKWIILRELKEDGEYLTRLMQKLMAELGQRDHLVIKVNKSYFNKTEDVIASLQEKFGVLQNCRVEVDTYQQNVGIILESQTGIADGSFDTQMKIFDSLFHEVIAKT